VQGGRGKEYKKQEAKTKNKKQELKNNSKKGGGWEFFGRFLKN